MKEFINKINPIIKTNKIETENTGIKPAVSCNSWLMFVDTCIHINNYGYCNYKHETGKFSPTAIEFETKTRIKFYIQKLVSPILCIVRISEIYKNKKWSNISKLVEFENYYANNDRTPIIKAAANRLAVVMYNNKPHRVQILNAIDSNTFQVQFIDINHRDNYKINQLYNMKVEYAYSANKLMIAGVVPINGRLQWQNETIALMRLQTKSHESETTHYEATVLLHLPTVIIVDDITTMKRVNDTYAVTHSVKKQLLGTAATEDFSGFRKLKQLSQVNSSKTNANVDDVQLDKHMNTKIQDEISSCLKSEYVPNSSNLLSTNTHTHIKNQCIFADFEKTLIHIDPENEKHKSEVSDVDLKNGFNTESDSNTKTDLDQILKSVESSNNNSLSLGLIDKLFLSNISDELELKPFVEKDLSIEEKTLSCDDSCTRDNDKSYSPAYPADELNEESRSSVKFVNNPSECLLPRSRNENDVIHDGYLTPLKDSNNQISINNIKSKSCSIIETTKVSITNVFDCNRADCIKRINQCFSPKRSRTIQHCFAELKFDKFQKVKLVAFYSPSQFYLQNYDKQSMKKLQEINENINEYTKNKEHLLPPKDFNGFCLAKFNDGNFNRCEILLTKYDPNGITCRVRCLDYGFAEDCPSSNIFELPNKLFNWQFQVNNDIFLQ